MQATRYQVLYSSAPYGNVFLFHFPFTRSKLPGWWYIIIHMLDNVMVIEQGLLMIWNITMITNDDSGTMISCAWVMFFFPPNIAKWICFRIRTENSTVVLSSQLVHIRWFHAINAMDDTDDILEEWFAHRVSAGTAGHEIGQSSPKCLGQT